MRLKPMPSLERPPLNHYKADPELFQFDFTKRPGSHSKGGIQYSGMDLTFGDPNSRGRISSSGGWIPAWAAQQLNNVWQYVEQHIRGSQPGDASDSIECQDELAGQEWNNRYQQKAAGQLLRVSSLPQALQQGIKVLQANMPQLLHKPQDTLQLPVTSQQAAEASARRLASAGGSGSVCDYYAGVF